MIAETNPASKPDPYAPAVQAWADDLDRYLDTDAGRAWLADMEDRIGMERAAHQYGTRPGLDS